MSPARLRLVVTGLSGQVVSALIERCPRDIEIIAVGRPQLDLAHRDAVIATLRAARCDAIIEQIREAIMLLPAGQREVVELHKLRGMTMAQVAERLEIREGAARVRAHRGYKALARILGVGVSSMLMLVLVLQRLGVAP